MFAGIIEHVGHVVRVATAPQARAAGAAAYRLTLALGPLAEGLPTGASVAVNGACLTLAALRGTDGEFDVVPETWERTTLRTLRPRDSVNLERSLRLGDRIDGHFVQGHVDGTAAVEAVDRAGGEWRLHLRTDPALAPYLVAKGSVAVDGVSLTIVDAAEGRFSVALIPTTLERTVLGTRRPGDLVNIETDILARLIVRRLDQLLADGGTRGLTLERLAAAGFLR